MSKTKKPPQSRGAIPKLPAQVPPASAPVQTHAVRETVESIVIAFVLAFLFRTFEAEAFVIPTGSMAPTLMGRHKDVDCPKCGYRYQVSASEEESEDPARPASDCIAGMCPICRYVLPMRQDIPQGVPEKRLPEIDFQRSYNGDRILVNKYVYTFSDPERWDVVVFKFPGDAKINYIKRLVGLPGETLRIYQGDLLIGGKDASRDDEFKIERKPPDKVLAMRQLVHDTSYDSAELADAGWPLRWNPPSGSSADGWKIEKEEDGINVRQRYVLDRNDDGEAWLRYEHIVPDYAVWQQLNVAQSGDKNAAPFAGMKREEWPRQLITDSNPYNGRVARDHEPFPNSLQMDPTKQGVHWVGDLMVEADVEVKAAAGEMLLDLVEGGQHFTCNIDLKSGEATLGAVGVADYAPKAKTPLQTSGNYHVTFANVDDQLLLWIDGDLILFEGGTAYDAERVFGDRRRFRPETSQDDPGDWAPVGIGGRGGAKLVVDRLRVWRDVYYIADSSKNRQRFGNLITDFDSRIAAQRFSTVLPREVVGSLNMGQMPSEASLAALPRGIAKALRNTPQSMEMAFFSALPQSPSLWDSFLDRRSQDFKLGDEQLFVMGDNSAESSDARLWYSDLGRGGQPGGDYLEKRLLIGKALCVYWPHSWHRIPGTPIPFPLFPNFADMRLVR